jgi:hypothetical protein
MNLIFKPSYFLFLFLLLCNFACTQVSENGEEKKYSLYILSKDGREYIVETNTLDSGQLNPDQIGADLQTQKTTRTVIVKNGFYYHLNRKNASFEKYKINDREMIEVAAAPLSDFSIENYRWMNGDTLLLTGLDAKTSSQAKYVILKTGNMQEVAAGNMEIPLPQGRFNSISIGFVERRNQQLLVGYTYHQWLDASNYTTSDTTYVTKLTYPQMTAVKTSKDTRSTYPGGINTLQPYSFNDEQGNYFFMTCPGIALGNRPELPTGVMRINANEDAPDKDYFLNLSASVTHNHAYGMWYLGNHQAIIRSERKDLFKGLGDHYSTPHFEFYLIDVAEGKVIKKLDLPLDKGTRRECVLIQNNIAYISINSATAGNYIWLYNIQTGTLKKGLQLVGNTDFILRIDKL